MNEVDIAILVVIGISCLFGLWRGLIKEVLSLLTWIAALLIARIYSQYLSDMMTAMIENEGARYVTAFALLFVIVMLLGTLLNFLLSKLLTISGLKFADRVFGAVFGVARGMIIVLLVMFVSNVFVSDTQRWQQSVLIPYGMDLIERSRIFIGDINSVEAA